MVRKLKSKENNIISFEEYKENKENYYFDVEVPLKSDLNLEKQKGQSKKLERLTKTLNIRIGEIEEDILSLGADENDMSKSDFVRFLILQYGKTFVKDKIEENYYNSLKKYNSLLQELKIKNELRSELLEKRGADKKTANQLCYQRTKLKYEIENIKSEMNHLTAYLKRYKTIFED